MISGRTFKPYKAHKHKSHSKACYVCGKIFHYADKCWFMQDAKVRPLLGGAILGHSLGSLVFYRGAGRRRSTGDRAASQYFSQGAPTTSAGNENWGFRQVADEDPPNQNITRDSNRPASYFRKSMSDHAKLDPGFQGDFMARKKYISSTSAQNPFPSNFFIIDSGRSHQFIRNQRLFVKYRRIEAESVQSATGGRVLSRWCRAGRLPIDGGILVEAFHTPNFSTNIISVAQLSRMLNFPFAI